MIAGGLVILALDAFLASFIPLPWILDVIVSSRRNDDQLLRGADSLARNFPGIVVKLRICSAAVLLAAIAATLQRARIQDWIAEAILPLPRFLRDVAGSVVRGLKADGKLFVWVLLALTVLASALRVVYLFQPLRVDESETFLSYASRPLYVGLSWYPAPNNHLLHTMLVHFSWQLFGEREWAVRLPALFAGILVIPVTCWAARALYDKHAALIAASLVTAASPLISYSVDGRGYTMVAVFFLLLLIVSQYLLEHPSQPAWLLWVVIASCGCFTIPTMLYPIATAALWMLLCSRGRLLPGLCIALAATGIISVLLYVPVLVASGWGALFSNSYVKSKGFAFLFENLPANASLNWRFLTADVPTPLVWLLIAGFVTALVFHRRLPGYGVPVPLAAALCIAPLLLVQRVLPPARVWIFLVPLGAAATGAGLWFLVWSLGRNAVHASRLSAVAALACLVAMCIPDLRGTRFAFWASLPRVEDAAVWLKDHLSPTDTIVVRGAGWSPLSYYFRRHGVPFVSRPAPCDAMSLVYTSRGARLGAGSGSGMRVLAVSSSSQDPETILSRACLAWQPTLPPRLVYDTAGIRVYEGYAGRGPKAPVPANTH
jgi:hypothetical protein